MKSHQFYLFYILIPLIFFLKEKETQARLCCVQHYGISTSQHSAGDNGMEKQKEHLRTFLLCSS